MRYLVVLDFEATCDEVNAPVPQEVIEFPSVLFCLEKREPVDEFSSFVRPLHHPQLTRFCRELTGIEQADVDGAPLFPEVLQRHTEWLAPYGTDWAFTLCGDWDLKRLFPTQCAACVPALEVPPAWRRWINLKHVFAQTLGLKKGLPMTGMLEALGLELQGRHHRGIDDCRNIARIAKVLLERGAQF